MHIKCLIFTTVLLWSVLGYGQSVEGAEHISSFTGDVSLTTNGFSIIPIFSLNNPAVNALFSWRKGRFSFDPDIRLVPDFTRGGLIWWVRYHMIEKEKFSLKVGAHPAFTFVRKDVIINGKPLEISELLRFFAFQIEPNYKFNNHLGVGAMLLRGQALQRHGIQRSRVLFLNTMLTNIPLGGKLYFETFPSFYVLRIDDTGGEYFINTAVLGLKDSPLSLRSSINHTFRSDIEGNIDFMWNVSINYHFRLEYQRSGPTFSD